MKNIQYESDKPRILVVPDITDLTNVQEFYETEDGEGGCKQMPQFIKLIRYWFQMKQLDFLLTCIFM